MLLILTRLSISDICLLHISMLLFKIHHCGTLPNLVTWRQPENRIHTASRVKHHLYFCWNKFHITEVLLNMNISSCCVSHKYLNENLKLHVIFRYCYKSWVFAPDQNFLILPWNLQEVIPNILKQCLCILHTKLSTFIDVHKVATTIRWPLGPFCWTFDHILGQNSMTVLLS